MFGMYLPPYFVQDVIDSVADRVIEALEVREVEVVVVVEEEEDMGPGSTAAVVAIATAIRAVMVMQAAAMVTQAAAMVTQAPPMAMRATTDTKLSRLNTQFQHKFGVISQKMKKKS